MRASFLDDSLDEDKVIGDHIHVTQNASLASLI